MKAKNVENRKDYQQYINELVDCMIEDMPENENVDWHDQIHTTTDSSRILMYHPIDILRFSDNNPKDWEHLVSENSHWKDVIRAMAYDVIYQDISEELRENDSIHY